MDQDVRTWQQIFMANWLWLCPVFGIAVAVGVLIVFGLSFWTAVIATLLLVCPALIVWGALELRNNPKNSGRGSKP